jgi:Protein of unknown function (DUF3667)
VAREKTLETEPCRNCGDTTPGVYCRMCGQRKGDVRISVRSLIAEVLEDQLAITSTLPRTIAALFLHPGKLTEEYTKGRIASWIAPFRLYVAASLVFFFTISITSRIGIDRSAITSSIESGPQASEGPAGDSAAGPRSFGIFIEPSLLTGDSADLARAVQSRTGIARLDRLIEQRIRGLAVLGPQQAGRAIISNVVQRAPTAMFLLLPVFALLVQLLYLRSRRYYVEHIVFSLHYHAFAFTLNTLMVLFENTVIPAILGLWLLLYLPLALHRVYRNNWIVTLAKSVVLGVTYLFVLSIALIGTLVVAVLIG